LKENRVFFQLKLCAALCARTSFARSLREKYFSEAHVLGKMIEFSFAVCGRRKSAMPDN
jgi:hypothetical protein